MNKLFKIIVLLLLAFTTIVGCKKQNVLIKDNTKSYLINSNQTGEIYNLQILYPDNYDTVAQYPVVCLLDGDWYFNEMAEIVNKKFTSDLILIGIGYKTGNNRAKDFTFPADDMYSNSGYANEFIQFINYELLPFIQLDLSIKPSELTLAGHSLGGYFALYQLFQQDFPNPFDNIIAASPSLFWSEAYILDLEEEFYNNNDTLNKKVLITMGDLEGVTMNTMFDAFNDKIESRNYSGLLFMHMLYENITHNNNPIISFEEGISLILK